MLKVEENYLSGIPQTILQVFPSTGVGWHWSAGANGRAGWQGTINHLINTRYTVNASYHGGFWHEHDTETTVVQWIVQRNRAAHSVNPAECWKYHATKPRATQDARFAEVRRILGAKAADPNAGMLALAYAGMPNDLERDLACPIFRADVQNLAKQLVDIPVVIDRPHFGHGWIQPISRYEMDVAFDFIGLLYGEDDVDYLKGADPIVNRRAIIADGATVRSAPAFERTDYDAHKLFTISGGSNAPILAWVTGTNITLADGTVYDARTRWAAIQGKSYGVGFVHERDVTRLEAVESSGFTQADIDAAKESATRAGFVDAKTKAVVAVQGIKP